MRHVSDSLLQIRQNQPFPLARSRHEALVIKPASFLASYNSWSINFVRVRTRSNPTDSTIAREENTRRAHATHFADDDPLARNSTCEFVRERLSSTRKRVLTYVPVESTASVGDSVACLAVTSHAYRTSSTCTHARTHVPEHGP